MCSAGDYRDWNKQIDLFLLKSHTGITRKTRAGAKGIWKHGALGDKPQSAASFRETVFQMTFDCRLLWGLFLSLSHLPLDLLFSFKWFQTYGFTRDLLFRIVICSASLHQRPNLHLVPFTIFTFQARHCEKSHKFNSKPRTSSKFNLEMDRTIHIVHVCFWRVGEELARLSQRVPQLLLRQDASAAYVGHIVLIEPSSKTDWIKHAMLNSSLMLICLIM